MEVWKDVKGFEGVYKVSNYGRLKSFKRLKDGFILSNKNKAGEYLSVVLQYKNKIRYVRMHTIVAEAFIDNPLMKPEVNHKDGNKQNNHVDNLEWSTRKENVHHAIKNGFADFKAMNNYNKNIKPRTIIQKTLSGSFMASFINGKEAAKATGVCQRNILQVANKTEYKPGLTRKQAGGFVWEFENGI